jgi:uncharacterized protein YcbK (DUF882 family)
MRSVVGIPSLQAGEDVNSSRTRQTDPSRRRIALAGLALAAGVRAADVAAAADEPLVFRPGREPGYAAPSGHKRPLALGEIPSNFWDLPRELWLLREATREQVRAVYYADGRIQPDGYWQLCAVLRDVSANVMTRMNPLVLDVLRGIYGFYQAWRYHQPIVVTSGFRTDATNRRLLAEGAARNSMHLYGCAVDLRMPGVRADDLGRLVLHLRAGGVGIYADRNFVHADTGRLRTWRG